MRRVKPPHSPDSKQVAKTALSELDELLEKEMSTLYLKGRSSKKVFQMSKTGAVDGS
jgi:hypothetical protein